MKQIIYDIAGIGIGPFNLGMAALAAPIENLQCIFFDAKPSFSWHEGMLLDFSKLQVPFYADLVTSADTSNPFSFMSYLKRNNRFYQFAILEENYISRKEYNAYCKWVVAQLKNLYFGHTVTSIQYDDSASLYALTVDRASDTITVYAKQIVIGIGSVPSWPEHLQVQSFPDIIHSSTYLHQKKTLLEKDNITVIGSGQSAAEIFYDLLLDTKGKRTKLNWLTRAVRFHPMETSKLTLEMTSPDYINYFYGLSPHQKQHTLAGQQFLYKGINSELIAAIYRQLYDDMEEKNRFLLRPNCELKSINQSEGGYNLQFFHLEKEQLFEIQSEVVILATGYKPAPIHFLEGIRERIRFGENGKYDVHPNYAVDRMGKNVFVQNAELHSHGFNAPDLGMGPYRNAVILNSILGYEYFQIEERIPFQSFDLD